MQHDEAHRYLGVYITTDGNYKREFEMFKQRNTRYTNLLQECPFTHQEI